MNFDLFPILNSKRNIDIKSFDVVIENWIKVLDFNKILLLLERINIFTYTCRNVPVLTKLSISDVKCPSCQTKLRLWTLNIMAHNFICSDTGSVSVIITNTHVKFYIISGLSFSRCIHAKYRVQLVRLLQV